MTKIKRFQMGVVLTFLLLSCKGDKGDPGPTGSKGDQGAIGQTGLQGPTGTANVIYSDWFTSGFWTGNFGSWYFDRSAPQLTQAILDRGVVLCYAKLVGLNSNLVLPLPVTGLPGSTYWNFFINGPGIIRIITDASGTPSNQNQFRYVIIPGGISGGRSATVNYANYDEVKAYYNLPD
jgi:hypothetical protein